MLTEFQQDRLEKQHRTLQYLFNTPPEILDFHPEGKWSIKDQIAHLVKYQPKFLGRMKLIISQEAPSFERYNADADPEFSLYRKLSLHELWDRLLSGREDITGYLGTLSEHQLQRIGIHPVYGELSIGEWTEFFLLHEAHHLFCVFQLSNKQDL